METTYRFDIVASIDDDVTNALTEDHLRTHNTLCPQEAYPELFGEDFPHSDVLVYKGREIVKRKDIVTDRETTTSMYPRMQNARATSSVKESEYKKLKENFHHFGLKLNLQQPLVFRDATGRLRYITGHTRDKVYDEYNFSDIIVNVYEPAPGATDTQQQNTLSQFGVEANPDTPPSVPADMLDITYEIERALKMKWITTEEEAMARARSYLSTSGLSKSKLDACALSAYSSQQANPMDKKIPLFADEAAQWLEDHNFVDIKGKVKYFSKSYDFSSKATVDCVMYAAEHPDEEVRIVVHGGVVSTEDQWTNRIENFYLKYKDILKAFKTVVFDDAPIKAYGKDQHNIRLYGAIPQIGSLHNLDKICFFDNSGDGTTYQK